MSEPCLHCAIHRLIVEHAREHGAVAGNTAVLSLDEVLSAFGQVIGDLVSALGESRARHGAIAYAASVAMATAQRRAEETGSSPSHGVSVGLH